MNCCAKDESKSPMEEPVETEAEVAFRSAPNPSVSEGMIDWPIVRAPAKCPLFDFDTQLYILLDRTDIEHYRPINHPFAHGRVRCAPERDLRFSLDGLFHRRFALVLRTAIHLRSW